MSNKLETIKKQLPTIDQLINDDSRIVARDESTKLMVLLNQPPPTTWIAKHPFIKKEVLDEQGNKQRVPYEYLPINKVEFLLNKIFVHYKIEVLKTGMLLNSVECHVRVHYVHPLTNEWMYHDGVGAQEIQTAKDTGSLKLDMSNINKSAIQMALPIAKTIAIKDACDHFGKLFGSDLNRNSVMNYDVLLKPSVNETNDLKEQQRVLNYISSCTTIGMLETVKATADTLGLQKEYQAKEAQING